MIYKNTIFNTREKTMIQFFAKIVLIITTIILLIFIHKDYIYKLWTQPKPGVVIILNGPSAVGKSSLQKAIQKLAQKPYISLGIDSLFNDPFPDEHGSLGTKTNTDFEKQLRHVTIDNNTVYLHIGQQGQKIVSGMNQAIAAYAQAGNNVVVDYIMYEKSWMQELLKNLSGCPVYLVGVTAPLETIQERERSRSTSPIGHAKSHYNTVHEGNNYDLWIDTSLDKPEQGADKILKFIINNPKI